VLGQVSVNPTVTPVLNNGGWVYITAVLLTLLAILVALAVVFGYMRLAPRFQTDEETRKSVRLPRRQPGGEVRRPVNVVGAPAVVQAPVAVAAAPAPAAAPAATATATLAPPAAAPAPAAAAAAPAAEAPATPATAAEAPAAAAPAAPAPAPAEHAEVSLDQETFDRVLAELLEKGTDRRVAEGQARRAAMIAARKKAEG
jgi:hypothetical protein